MTPQTATPSTSAQTLHGNLSATAITFFVVAAAAPLFVMAGVGALAVGIGGIGAPAGYLFAGIALAIFTAGFTAMTKHIRNAGAFYAYIAKGLGSGPAVVSSVVALVSYNVVEIGMFGALGYFTDTTLDTLAGINLPWWLWALVGVVIIWQLGSRSIDVGAKFLIALLALETAVLVVLAVAILWRHPHGITFTSFAPQHVAVGSMGAVLAFAFAAFMGFESTALYREESQDPDRAIPRATLAAVAFLGLFYAFMVWIIVQAYGPADAVNVANTLAGGLFFDAMEQYVGTWAVDVMSVLIITSILASLLAFHNAITRYAYALSREGVLPPTFGRLHPRYFAPYIAGRRQSVLAALVVIIFAVAKLDPLTQLLIWVNTPGIFGILLLQALVGVSVVRFFRKDRRGHTAWRVVVAPVVGSALMLMAIVLVAKNITLLTGSTPTTSGVNLAIMAVAPISVVLGVVVASRLKKTRPEAYAAVGTRNTD
ncbi:APC family permease [Embleya sp. MST-111070]|uniref:APC family permease n=1 Tax=Embleya sp. MST-111070 TaxID=3398231 RepID=UPI003F73E409